MSQLLSNFGKQGVKYGLLTQKVDIEDTEYLSKYFVIAEFNPILVAGRNPVAFNGSSLLQPGSEIKVECYDSNGNSLYIEQAKATDTKFSDVANFILSIHVYDENYNGTGKLVLVGTTKKGEVVRWIGNISIDKTLKNAAKVRFYYKPTLEVRPLLYPVVDTTRATVKVPPPPTPRLATAVATVDSVSKTVTSITVTYGGVGYESAPVVRISGIGTGAAATSHITNGVVTSITVDSGGTGYTSAPTVIIADPSTTVAPELNIPVQFSSSFYAYAATPAQNTNKSVIDAKRLDIDYRLVLTGLPDVNTDPTRFPTGSFNTQMEGKEITLNIQKIQLPFSYDEQSTNITASYTIKKVLDSKTAIINDAFYYQSGKDQIVTNIVNGLCSVSYGFIQYNTNAEANLAIKVTPKSTVNVKESHAEITYRNLKTYSGFVARHKIYRRSLFYPGDFQLISDNPLDSIELLSDQVTFNKSYDKIGTFYNQFHIDKYWWPTSTNLTLEAKSTPINAMHINGGDPSTVDGTSKVIAKLDSIGITNDNVYYPYDSIQFNNLSGQSYNSNFISLKKDALYVLSTNVIIQKDVEDTTAKISFYFTSSSTSSLSGIQKEANYESGYGLKLGEIATIDKVEVKNFNGIQQIFFTPKNDYFGTLTIVPYHCNVILSDLSLKVYGDRGFSPDILFYRIPFPINVKNEAFEIKAELFDINSNLIYSDLKTIKTFDTNGDSLLSNPVTANPLYSYMSVDTTNPSSPVIRMSSTSFDMPGEIISTDMPLMPDVPNRLVGWQFPSDDPNTIQGKLCYTNISKLFIDRDYISLSTVDDSYVEHTAKALAIRYDGANGWGRRIYFINGVKFRDPPGSGI